MRGANINWPGCPKDLANEEKIEDSRNVYDQLWLQNLYDVFGKYIEFNHFEIELIFLLRLFNVEMAFTNKIINVRQWIHFS